jgi:predicted glycosyltransferase
MKKILIYSHDTFGLGNIRRMLEVARHLVERSPTRCRCWCITGSPMLHAFRIPPGIDYVKLPCLAARHRRPLQRAFAEPMSLDETVRLRANLIKQRHRRLPARRGAGRQEALRRRGRTGRRAARRCRAHQHRPRLVLLLRDILDSAEVTQRIWRKNGYFEAIDAYYDQVLVVGSPDIYDLRQEYDFPPFAAAKVRYCGYIAREPGRPHAQRARRATGRDGSPAAGAGHARRAVSDGYSAGGRTALAAWRACRADAAAAHARGVRAGDGRTSARRCWLQRRPCLPNVSLQDFCDDMMSLHRPRPTWCWPWAATTPCASC